MVVGKIQKSFFSAKLLLLVSVGFGILFGTAYAAPKPITKTQLNAQIAAVNAARAAADSAEAAVRQAADSAEASTRQATDNALSAAINSSKHFIGEQYGGGIVFYVYDDGQHGLISASVDQSTGIRWYGGSSTVTRARASGIGGGKTNTALIIANQAAVDGNPFAATVCNEYSAADASGVTFGDWYLPSKLELDLMYNQRALIGATSTNYWSSTETDASFARARTFLNGGTGSSSKLLVSLAVRCIRIF